MYMGWWQKQVCLRDALIDDLVRQVDIWKAVATAEANMSEVMRKELAAALDKNEKLRPIVRKAIADEG